MSSDVQSDPLILSLHPELQASASTPLIGKGLAATVQLDPQGDYRLRQRSFASPARMFEPFYRQLNPRINLGDVAFAEAESLTRADLLVLPTWPLHGGYACGSTFGHEQHDPHDPPNAILEICECLSGYAALLIDRPGDVLELVLLQPGDKVGTPDRCLVTHFGLGPEPVVVARMANPARRQIGQAIPDTSGPTLVPYVTRRFLRLRLNPGYVNRPDKYGVRNPQITRDAWLPRLNPAGADSVYRALRSLVAARQLAARGIRVTLPDRRALAAAMHLDLADLSPSLLDLRKDRPGPIQDYLFRPVPPLPPSDGMGRILVFGGGGELGQKRLQPALRKLPPGIADRAEMLPAPQRHSRPA